MPEVWNAELLRLVAQGVCGLGGLVRFPGLRVDIGDDFGACVEGGDKGEVGFVVFAEKGVGVG